MIKKMPRDNVGQMLKNFLKSERMFLLVQSIPNAA